MRSDSPLAPMQGTISKQRMSEESFKKWVLGLYSPFVKSDTIGLVSGLYILIQNVGERGSNV